MGKPLTEFHRSVKRAHTKEEHWRGQESFEDEIQGSKDFTEQFSVTTSTGRCLELLHRAITLKELKV